MNGVYSAMQPMRNSGLNYPSQMNGYPPSASDGRILFVNSYEDVRRTSLPMDGSITLFMIRGESVFYTAYMQGNLPLVSGYSFTPLGGEQQTSAQSNGNDLESRLARLESFQKEIMDMLGGSSNESNLSANQPKQRK